MAQTEYVGAIACSIDGTEYEVADMNVQTKTGIKRVKTMNSQGKAKGYSKGIPEHDLSITLVIPSTDTKDWRTVTDAKITITPLDNGTPTSYTDCSVTEVSEKYSVDNEARRDLKLFALDYTIE